MSISFYDLSSKTQHSILSRISALNVVCINDKTNCYELQKYLTKEKYGHLDIYFRKKGRKIRIHRLIYEYWNGISIPENLIIMHSCDNPSCINPMHLSLGTMADNTKDKYAKNRGNNNKGEKHPQAKLTEKEVLEIKILLGSKEFSHSQLANQYNVSSDIISNIARGRSWKHI